MRGTAPQLERAAQRGTATLSASPCARVLDLQRCELSVAEAHAWSDHFSHMTQRRGASPLLAVQVLDLQHCELGAPEALALSGHLARLTALQRLHVLRNDLKADALAVLAPIIPHLKSLVSLDLAENRFGDDGAKLLAQHLTGLLPLERLTLDSNELTDEGAKDLSPCFAALPALVKVSLCGNEVSAAGVHVIREDLDSSQSLTLRERIQFHLDENNVEEGETEVEKLCTMLSLNVMQPNPDA